MKELYVLFVVVLLILEEASPLVDKLNSIKGWDLDFHGAIWFFIGLFIVTFLSSVFERGK